MPVYTYRCQSCGVEFKKMQTFFAMPLKRCPECHRGALRRVLQLPAIVFKGSGWYSTDHRAASGVSGQKQDQPEHALSQQSAN